MPKGVPPSSFNFEPAKSTKYASDKMLKRFDKWLKMNPPPMDPRSGIKGIVTVPGGASSLIRSARPIIAKYVQSFIRRMKPDMFTEPLDVVAELLDENGNYKPTTTTYKLYKEGSYNSSVSALISSLNRLAIGEHTKESNAATGDDLAGDDKISIINVNHGEWMLIKQAREKMSAILFCHQLHHKIASSNKELHSLSVDNICKMFQNLNNLTKKMIPMVCIQFSLN